MKQPLIVPYGTLRRIIESSVCIAGVNPKNVSIFVSSRGGNRSQVQADEYDVLYCYCLYLRFQPTT